MYCFNSTSNPTIHCSRASHVSITPLPSPSSPLSSRLKGGRVAVEPRPQCGSRPIYLRIRKPVSAARSATTLLSNTQQYHPTLNNTAQHLTQLPNTSQHRWTLVNSTGHPSDLSAALLPTTPNPVPVTRPTNQPTK